MAKSRIGPPPVLPNPEPPSPNHSEADDVIPFADSRELARARGLSDSALVVVGTDHRLAGPESLKVMLATCKRSVLQGRVP